MRRTSSLGIAVIVLLSSACARVSSANLAAEPRGVSHSIADGYDASVRRDVETLRSATDRFHDLAAATAAGYPSKTPRCVADSTMGGMGQHYFDRALYDGKLEIERPEMLIYAPAGDGKVELVGVEYVVPYSILPRTEKPPRLFGQDLKPYDEFKYWALHVWAWRKNAAGLFADWNPAVKC
jgi:hypothetical protein